MDGERTEWRSEGLCDATYRRPANSS